MFPLKRGKLTPASYIETASKSERTSSGIRVGITVARFKELIKRPVKCVIFAGAEERCYTNGDPATHVGTRFSFYKVARSGPMRLGEIYVIAATPRARPRTPNAAPPENPNLPSQFTVTGSDGSPCPCRAGDTLAFDAYKQPDESHALIVRYAWDFGVPGDSLARELSPDPSADYTYAHAGTYTVTLTMTDEGGREKTLTQQVQIQDAQ